MALRTLCILGTRPDAIKMAPVVKNLDAASSVFNQICVTGQHQQMLDSVLNLFDIVPHFSLSVMVNNQNLSELSAKILVGLNDVFRQSRPDVVLVHGDTTTCVMGALAAHYARVPVAHVEAGLRTGDMYFPWPEEMNRKLTDALSTLHFAPTANSRLNLLKEGFSSDSIYVTGNTVIDALFYVIEKLERDTDLLQQMKKQFSFLIPSRKMLLVTGHRRESFGDGFERICQALARIALKYKDIDIVYPVHLNPNVQEPVKRILGSVSNIYLIEPVDYMPFVYLMKACYFILTDSGGVQEEAPSLGKPVLVMRDKTERPEALEAGVVRLVGTSVKSITAAAEELLENEALYQKMSISLNPYGDGQASKRILNLITQKVISQGVESTAVVEEDIT